MPYKDILINFLDIFDKCIGKCYICNVVTVASAVEEIVKGSPLLEDGLARDIISYSALARELRPVIEKRLIKSVQRGAIVMALKRISVALKQKHTSLNSIRNLADLTVRSKLKEFTFANSDTIVKRQKDFFEIVTKRNDIFSNFSQGVRETTLIVSEEITEELTIIFKNEKLLSKIEKLSSITIRFHKEIVNTPGVYYSILKLLAWEGINVIEVVSTSMELTIIFNTNEVDRAFSVLKNVE